MATPPPVTDTTRALRYRHGLVDHVRENLGQCQAAYPRHPRRRPGRRRPTGSGDRARLLPSDSALRNEASIWGTRQKASVARLLSPTACSPTPSITTTGMPSSMSAIRPSMIIGAALPLAEHIGASGKDLLKAYVLGIEVICKIAANRPTSRTAAFTARRSSAASAPPSPAPAC